MASQQHWNDTPGQLGVEFTEFLYKLFDIKKCLAKIVFFSETERVKRVQQVGMALSL